MGSLGSNNIGVDGAAAIAEALKTNTAVIHLQLVWLLRDYNSIGAEIDRFVQTILSARASGSVVPACSNLGAVDEATGQCNCLYPAFGTGPTCSDNTIVPEGIRRAQLQTEIADLEQSNLDKDAKVTELEAKLASAGFSRYLTITNDDFINLAEVAAFDASGNQLTPVHASMNNEYGHGHGANKCIDGIDGRV